VSVVEKILQEAAFDEKRLKEIMRLDLTPVEPAPEVRQK
jgi:hypothetical protein